MRISIPMAVAGLVLLTACSAPGGAEEVVLDVLLPDDTIYAPGYTDDQFNSVKVGMTEAEVHRRIGSPIDKWSRPLSPREESMRWTRSARDSNYKIRVLVFRSGRVSKKFAEFYVD